MGLRRAVYTVLLGGYEQLGEQHVAAESDVPFICFTDDPSLTSDSWQIRPFTPAFPLDLTRSQREFKIRGNAELREYDETLYIDNAVQLRVKPEDILDEWLADDAMAVPLHSFRDRLIDEFDEVIALGYDDAGRVNEQLQHYADLYPEVLATQPHWNGMIARKNRPEVWSAMEVWYDHVLRFSRRDQLSSNVALHIAGLAYRSIELDNNISPLHEWPVDVKRRAALASARKRSGPLLAEVARLERALQLAEDHVAALTQELDERTAAAESERAVSQARERELAERLAHEERRAVSAENELSSILKSQWWRATRPLRSLTGLGRGTAAAALDALQQRENHH